MFSFPNINGNLTRTCKTIENAISNPGADPDLNWGGGMDVKNR